MLSRSVVFGILIGISVLFSSTLKAFPSCFYTLRLEALAHSAPFKIALRQYLREGTPTSIPGTSILFPKKYADLLYSYIPREIYFEEEEYIPNMQIIGNPQWRTEALERIPTVAPLDPAAKPAYDFFEFV